MNNKIINQIALEDSNRIKRGNNIKLIGFIAMGASLAITVIGEIISNKDSLKIYAKNNEAADLIEELDNIWSEQHK